jgi:hypothetical protein
MPFFSQKLIAEIEGLMVPKINALEGRAMWKDPQDPLKKDFERCTVRVSC